MAQVQVITGPTRYRSWSDERKQELVAAAFAPGAVVTDVAREADVSASLLYRWRRDFGAAVGDFADHPASRLYELSPWNWRKPIINAVAA